ncbi:hypothetical protein CIHG_07504 [Coccidioides immitis H538.4]|uniref:Uncharacterized protein n=3 Tax=Coccidioides immitis TaxID=5501 RepID=A0A0J8QRA1_COCIT|nr:hypothetical protein CIRG_02360 [Coccidioides immitis RMSCC 2394]KMU74605.1 hypothetical protein CISG_04312 [Coccidioides immitis RMSCC 3703]KMU89697.1 hypothetical protein CIHG_07504 [Coccidioides immitis H538.4]
MNSSSVSPFFIDSRPLWTQFWGVRFRCAYCFASIMANFSLRVDTLVSSSLFGASKTEFWLAVDKFLNTAFLKKCGMAFGN